MSRQSYELSEMTEPSTANDDNGVQFKSFNDRVNTTSPLSKEDAAESETFIEKEVADDEDDTYYPHGCCSRWLEKVEDRVHAFLKRYNHLITTIVKVVLLLLYFTYFGYCVHYRYHDEGSYILTFITAVIIIKILHRRLQGTKWTQVWRKCLTWWGAAPRARRIRKFSRYVSYVAAVLLLSVDLGVNVLANSPRNAVPIFGIFVILLFCFVFSSKPSKVNWHPVFWGFIIQFVFATLTLRTEIGYNAFKWMGDLVYGCVRLSDKGSEFVLGASFRAERAGFFFECAGVIVFFNACIFVLEYFGVLEFVVLKMGGALALCLETGPVESVIAAANIFVGLAEAPMIIRPYLPSITNSELHAIMVCGFSSISGAFMAMFIKAGASASHLLTAAVISAPAALALTKLYCPEVERVDYTNQRDIKMKDDEDRRNALQACSDGAAFSIKIVAAIMVNMLAFVSILNLVDSVLIWIGERAGIADMTFDRLCSYALFPISLMMGADPEDCGQIGSLIGIKLFATPFVAYVDLGKLIKNREIFEEYRLTNNGSWHWEGRDVILDTTNTTLVNGFMSLRSEVICTYALCGISALPAIGFTMGTLIPMCPARKKDVVKLIIRAYIAGNLVNIVTGAVAGVMYTGP